MTPRRYRATVEFEVVAETGDSAVNQALWAMVDDEITRVPAAETFLLDKIGPYTVTVVEIGATAERKVGF
jgi:hypothetical protein